MPEIPPGLYISQQDWSLHRQGRKDEARHDQKVKDAIRDNLPNIISDGDVITADPDSKKTIRIPLKSMELPDFRFGDNTKQIGSGDGEEGEIFDAQRHGPEDGKGAGEAKGDEYYETEFTMAELQELVFNDLGLPNLQPKSTQMITSPDITFDDRRKKRTPRNVDIKQTLLANMRRNAQEKGEAKIADISPEDIRVRTFREKEKPVNSAVVLLMMDRSGSMGDEETYLARAFCWWTVAFLRTKYPKVDVVFVVHETEAWEVEKEEDFFRRGSSGGTLCSSANTLTIDIIKNRFPPDLFNIYPIHLSDGDNFSTDNTLCLSKVIELLDLGIQQYGYVQVGQPSDSFLLQLYHLMIKDPRFNGLNVYNRKDVWPALQQMFKPDNI